MKQPSLPWSYVHNGLFYLCQCQLLNHEAVFFLCSEASVELEVKVVDM